MIFLDSLAKNLFYVEQKSYYLKNKTVLAQKKKKKKYNKPRNLIYRVRELILNVTLSIADVNVTGPIEKRRKRCRSCRYEREPVLHGFARARRTSALQP